MDDRSSADADPSVRVGIGLVGRSGSFLIRRRPPGGPMPGVWEFPGGKCEPGERPDTATARECFEEVGIAVRVGPLRRVTAHRYPHGPVELYYYDCVTEDPAAEPSPASGFLWVAAHELSALEFPGANAPILETLAREFARPESLSAMTSPIYYALAVAPVGLYLGVLAYWHGGSRPRVIPGLADFTLAAVAAVGVLGFGPFGDLVARLLFPKPDRLDRMVILSTLGLVATWFARHALNRVVVYHADPMTFVTTLFEVLNTSCGRFVPTLEGFEDRDQRVGVKVEINRRGDCAVLEAFGGPAENLIRQLRPRLRQALRATGPPPRTRLSPALYCASLIVTAAPLVAYLLTESEARDALRALLRRLGGG